MSTAPLEGLPATTNRAHREDMGRQPHRPEELQWKMFRGSDAIKDKVLSARQLRSTAWRRLCRDIYIDARMPLTHRLMCLAITAAAPRRVTIAGRSAAWLYGVDYALQGFDRVEILVGDRIRLGPRAAVTCHRVRIATSERRMDGPLVVTTPERTMLDIARWCDLPRAVAICDAMLSRRVTSKDALRGYVAAFHRRRGRSALLRVIDLADGLAQSPPESMTRVRLVLAGLPTPVCQHPVEVEGHRYLHPDLAWPAYKVALEYDGIIHIGRRQQQLDRERLNALLAAGWIVIHATAAHLREDGFERLVHDTRRALMSRGWSPSTVRSAGSSSARQAPRQVAPTSIGRR